jgi:phenylpropionate dioxygenase-like ring-hydroxylating dioxygenase large terminal subunit
MTLSLDQQERLVRVGPGTPAGTWLRRFWHPIELTEQLGDRPLPVRILGEDLALFRDADGQPRLLDDRCLHRGTQLHTGQVVDGCLECPYHGWTYDGHGQCVLQPTEPPAARFAERVRTTAYSTCEIGGLIFAYLGRGAPPECPAVPELHETRGIRRVITRDNPFNYFQLLENNVDGAHVPILHRSSPFESANWLTVTQVQAAEYRETEYGIDAKLVRFYLPNLLRLELPYFEPPAPLALWVVPVDDTSCRTFAVMVHFAPPSPEALQAAAIVPEQDRMAVGRQGVIYDRTRERLGASDRGIILLRDLYFRHIARALENDGVAQAQDVAAPADGGPAAPGRQPAPTT